MMLTPDEKKFVENLRAWARVPNDDGSTKAGTHGLLAIVDRLTALPAPSLPDREAIAKWIFNEHHPYILWSELPSENFETWFQKADALLHFLGGAK